MREHTMQIVADGVDFLHAWASEPQTDAMSFYTDVYLCGRCGAAVARSATAHVPSGGLIRCGNCAGLNAYEDSSVQSQPFELPTEDKPEVVVLDDEEGVLNMLSDFLEMEGYKVTCLSHPRQIDSLTGDHDPSLFLIDIMLPESSGLEVAARLRRDRYSNAPMIAMSASNIMVHSARVAQLFDLTISKPFDLGSLRETVHRFAA